MTLSTSYAAPASEPATHFRAGPDRPASRGLNEVMLSTMLRRGARGGDIARAYGLPPRTIAEMREAIGI